MILCKECFKFDEPWEEGMFDYYQWADATENFNDPHGRFCDKCGREFDDGELVALTEGDISSFKEIIEDRDDSSSIVEDIKWFMFDDAISEIKNEKGFSHGLQFETWAGGGHSFIVTDCNGVEYRVCISKEMK